MVLQVQPAIQPVEEAIKITYNALGREGQHIVEGCVPVTLAEL